jgi:uncharacterized protein YlzI (FlbEa/FlbD family)
MAALVKVTDFLSGQPVIVNADRIQSIKRMDEKTVIEFDRDRICCTESPDKIHEAVRLQG